MVQPPIISIRLSGSKVMAKPWRRRARVSIGVRDSGQGVKRPALMIAAHRD
jgi:hypothetical protein